MKKTIGILMVFAFVVTGEINSASCYAIPRREGIKVYSGKESATPERVVFSVGPDDRLRVVQQNGERLLIQDNAGGRGWISASDVAVTSSASRMRFEKAEVFGHIDNPELAIIFGTDDREPIRVSLERSFREQLLVNVDRETMNRRNR